MPGRVAVVTGANKGIGFAIVNALLHRFDGIVYLTSRDVARGQAAVAKLKETGLHPEYHQLDITDRNSLITFRDHLKSVHGGIDILINNAAIAHALEWDRPIEDIKNILDINYYSILAVKDILFPLVRDNGRILNISSDCGHLSNVRNKYWIDKLSRKDLTVDEVNQFVSWFLEGRKNGTFNLNDLADGGTFAGYRVAKVALSAVTKIFQKEYEDRNICINSMHPGLVRTDMTHGVGFYSVDDAAKVPVDIVLDAPDNIKGAYVWFDGRILDWYDYNADYYFKSSTLNAA